MLIRDMYHDCWMLMGSNELEQLIIPKHHSRVLTDVPDEALREILVRLSFLSIPFII